MLSGRVTLVIIVAALSLAAPVTVLPAFGHIDAPTAPACQAHGPLPDPTCTPGATDPRVTQDSLQQTICVVGYSKTVRPPRSATTPLKQERMAAYGYAGQDPAQFELDHLIPLELGGAPADVANLWAEPLAGEGGALQKDRLENELHARVCNGGTSLADAQAAVASDWYAWYVALNVPPPAPDAQAEPEGEDVAQPGQPGDSGQAAAAQPGGHTFYTSSYGTSRYYYCDTDPEWKGLSPTYLKSYASEDAVQAAYPSKTLHRPC